MNPIVKAWKNLFDRVAAKKAAKERHEASVRGSILISLPPESIFIPRYRRRRLEVAKSQVRHQRKRCERVRRYQTVTLRMPKAVVSQLNEIRARNPRAIAQAMVNDPVIGGALARTA